MSRQMCKSGDIKDKEPVTSIFLTECTVDFTEPMGIQMDKIKQFLKENKGVFENLAKDLAYDGFNAKITRERIMKSIQPRDIEYLVYHGMIYGNKISKNLPIMRNVKSRQNFLKIIKNVGISERVIPGKSSITLSRVIICFPDMACNIVAVAPDLPFPISMELLKVKIGIKTEERFPVLARIQGVSGLIPAQLSRNDKLTVFTLVTVCHLIISDILQRKNREWMEKSPKEKLVKSLTYTNLAYTSGLIENDKKVELSLLFKIITKSPGSEVLELVDEWHEPLTACEMFLKLNYDAEYKRVMTSMLNLAKD